MSFRLMTRFIELFDTVRDYTLQLLGSGFQWWTFSFLCVPELPLAQLPASNSKKSSKQLDPSSYVALQTTNANWTWSKHLSMDHVENVSFIIVVLCHCCRNMLVCGTVTQQCLLYSCLFHGPCLAFDLHTTISMV
jgi:hypothetical protein